MTREDYIMHWKQNARGKGGYNLGFAEHAAVRHDYAPGLTVIDWRNKNGSNNYYVRYIFDGSALIVRGDLGDAVFDRYSSVPALEWLGSMRDLYYIHEKLRCCTNEWNFNWDVWKTDFEEWCEECAPEAEIAAEIRDAFDEYGEDAGVALFHNDRITEAYGVETIAQISEFGRVLSSRFILWIEGLKMALEQLNSEKNESEATQ